MDNGTSLATRDIGTVLEQVVVKGDLSKLTEGERVTYYNEVCRSIGVNPLTQPFQYITLNGKLTLYATRACTDQLRGTRRLTAQVIGRERIDDVYVVTARVSAPDGRSDESIGAVTIGNLKSDALANALMKAETKAKRRATLSLIGLGWLDETEIETIPAAQVQAAPVAQAPQVLGPTRPRSAAPRAPEGTAATLYCADCHLEIRAVAVRGQAPLAPEVIAQKSLDKFGRELCFGCATKADDVRLDALHDPVTGEVSGSEAVAEEQPEF